MFFVKKTLRVIKLARVFFESLIIYNAHIFYELENCHMPF